MTFSPQPSVLSVLPSARDRLLAELTEELASLDVQGLLRRPVCLEAINGPLVRIDGRSLICWCSNDYLGLSGHPTLIDAARTATAEWGVGARASRLLAGTTRWHVQLEESLAAWFGAEAALVFPTGYQANLGTLGTLVAHHDVVVVDRLAHASLFDAVRASRATLRVFDHNDASHAATLLARATSARRRLIVTEGLFSMDGDCAPLADLLDVAEAQDATVYVDDAHGAFILGATGRGAPEAAGIAHERFLYMGTLGKALGAQGGFVIGPKSFIDAVRNRARTFIYTTGLAVPVVAAAIAALRVLAAEPGLRRRLWDHVERLRMRLATLPGISVQSQIVPVVIGQTQRTVQCARRLMEQGMWAPAIRPPTVAEGTARLRVSLTALHTEEHIDRLAEALRQVLSA